MLNYEFFLHKIQRQYIILSYFHLNLCMDLESSTLLCLHPLESYDLLFIIMHRCEYNSKECLAFKNHSIKCIALLNRLTHSQYIYILDLIQKDWACTNVVQVLMCFPSHRPSILTLVLVEDNKTVT